MFIGVYEDTLQDNKVFNHIYYYKNRALGWAAWNSDTFSFYTNILGILDFKIKGKTYKERKANLQGIAIEWNTNFSQYSWSYGELAEIQGFFEKVGKRYGLLREFKDNCIC